MTHYPYVAFLDTTQRKQLIGQRGANDNFWRYVEPHEISHQWWGHIIGWDSYHDQWMSEGFAEFSTSLYVQATRGNDKFIEFWEEHRKQIIEASPRTRDRRPYTVGPVTQGQRLSNAKTGATYQFLVYPKGAFILHMIRMMMFNQGGRGDAKFQAMMKDFIQTHFNQDVSTEDFKAAVEKGMGGNMDWFFNEWVYGIEMPSYRFDYQLSDGGTTLTGKITQSGVSDKFKMLVPVYIDSGKGWVKVGAAWMTGNTTVDLTGVKLPQAANRAAICALDDILALSIQNSK
jgi:aminopeptidase N